MVRATRERFKHRKFAAGEIDCLSFQAHTARSGINLKRSDPHHRVSAPAVATPQRAQPCGKFAKIERLAEIIVRPEVEPFDPILGHVARGQEQDRRRAARAAPFAQKIESGAVGKADIEHDGVMREARNRLARVGAIRDHGDRMAFKRKARTEEPKTELQALMSTTYAGFCLKKKK